MALPIGESQTISPPFIVAYMTEQLDVQPTDKVLEIGTGSGYQAAVLSPLAKEVYSIEIVKDLGEKAGRTLRRLKYENVHTKVADGYLGWPENAPFDKIIVTCSPEKVPTALVEQLREGGRMIVPVGERYQQILYLLTKKDGKLETESLQPTLFVPMTGAAEEKRQVLPDPLHPKIINGSFEEMLGETPRAAGWHYTRQMEVVKEPTEAQQGDYYARFSNKIAGRTNQALQGFAIDGRKIAAIDVSVWVKGDELRYGEDRQQWPRMVITFYDEKRAMAGEGELGPWMGTFGWRKSSKKIEVPLKAREAIVRIGLLGGIGELSVDDLKLVPVAK
jgi:protein-L-isoaspartate(D-aspartate) O-methyltransferase